MPLFLGETGELTDEWNARFRRLHETHGIGWSFWTYKNLDTPSTVVSIPRPEGWSEIVAFADGKRTDKPDEALIDRAIVEYLDGIRFRNGVVRWSYLESSGLKGLRNPSPSPLAGRGARSAIDERSDCSQRTGGALFQGAGAVVQARCNLHHALAVDFQSQLRGLLADTKRVPAHLLRATKQRVPFLHWPPSPDEIARSTGLSCDQYASACPATTSSLIVRS